MTTAKNLEKLTRMRYPSLTNFFLAEGVMLSATLSSLSQAKEYYPSDYSGGPAEFYVNELK